MTESLNVTSTHSFVQRRIARVAYLYTSIVPAVSFRRTASGVSAKTMEVLISAPQGSTNFELRTLGIVLPDQVVGVARWGYFSPEDGLLESFIEIDWIVLRSPGIYKSVPQLPPGKELAVVARWSRLGVGWLCVAS